MLDSKEWRFSEAANEAARRHIYPLYFERSPDEIEYGLSPRSAPELGNSLDLNAGTDRIVSVWPKNPNPKGRFQHSFSERFLRLSMRRYQHFTVTEYNPRTKRLNEIYKLIPQLFLFGYYDEDRDEIPQALIVNIADFLEATHRGDLISESERRGQPYKRNPRGQEFRRYRFDEMRRLGLVVFEAYEKGARFLTRHIPGRTARGLPMARSNTA